MGKELGLGVRGVEVLLLMRGGLEWFCCLCEGGGWIFECVYGGCV